MFCLYNGEYGEHDLSPIGGIEKICAKQKDGKLTVNECCAELGISRSTWYNKVKEV